MKVLGCLGFYSCYIKNLHVDSQRFCDLIRDSTPFHSTHEHEKLFQSNKDRVSEDTILAVPSTDYPFQIHVDSSNFGAGGILIQQFPEGKRIISFNSRIFDEAEQKMCTLHRELCGKVQSQSYKPLNTTLLGLLFLYTYIVIINRFFTYGDAEDNYPIGSSGTKSS